MLSTREYKVGDRIEGLYSAIVEYYKQAGQGHPVVGNYDRWFPGQISGISMGDKVIPTVFSSLHVHAIVFEMRLRIMDLQYDYNHILSRS